MTVPAPRYLYRYVSLPQEGDKEFNNKFTRLKHLLIESKVYMVCPIWFNDPFDCKVRLSSRGVRRYHVEQLVDYTAQRAGLSRKDRQRRKARWLSEWESDSTLIDRVLKMTEEIALDTSTHIGMLSLSESPDNILMWSHYADGHRGLCIKCDVSQFPEVDDKLHKVNYEEEYPRVTEYLHAMKHGDNEAAMRLLFTRKSKHWKYEDEWRYIRFFADGMEEIASQPVSFPLDAITGVIFGCAMRKRDRELVEAWLRERSCSVETYEAVKHGDRYELTIQERTK